MENEYEIFQSIRIGDMVKWERHLCIVTDKGCYTIICRYIDSDGSGRTCYFHWHDFKRRGRTLICLGKTLV